MFKGKPNEAKGLEFLEREREKLRKKENKKG